MTPSGRLQSMRRGTPTARGAVSSSRWARASVSRGRRGALAPAVLAMMAALVWSGLVLATRAHGGPARPLPDAAVLSGIADDVLRRASMGPESHVSEAIGPGADPLPGLDGVEAEPDPPFVHMDTAREGITVATPPGLADADIALPKTTGYRSNTGRRRDARPALSFSSGVLHPAPGLDRALQVHAATLNARGEPVVYGFLLLRIRLDEALERQLRDLGVALLGPHDDAYKARLPVGSLAAVAALPEVAWVGTSPPRLKQSRELAAVRGKEGQAAGVGPGTPLPIIINLFEGDESGHFRAELEAAGATLGAYDPELLAYRAVALGADLDRIAALDFVLFVELIQVASPGHDTSTPLIDADIIRPGTPMGHSRFGASTVPVGVMDTGFEIGQHVDLNKYGCGANFTSDPGGPFTDPMGHGTHVLATIAGTGIGNPRYRGVATAVGSIDYIRVARVWNVADDDSEARMLDALDFMSALTPCGGSVPPQVVNISGGPHSTGPQAGTDALSRKLDEKVWTHGQAYVVCSGNEGPLSRSIRRPGVAKNALTVGNVYDWGYRQVGEIREGSSRGPTGDNRLKPNVVAPGAFVTSASAGTTREYREDSGCSMATPHVTGLAATLMDHYPQFRGRPALLRAHLMATAIAHNDETAPNNDYGFGRVSGYTAHWDHPNSAGWSTAKFFGHVTVQGYQYGDITVPPGSRRLIVVMTWDEPAASAGSSRAVTYDLDLWVDHNADCDFAVGTCGEYVSRALGDNFEYVVIDNPPAGLYRLKVHPYNPAPFGLRYGMVARIIRGDPTPAMTAALTAPPAPPVGSTFQVTLNVATQSYVAYGAHVDMPETPPGVTFLRFDTTRHDGVNMTFSSPDGRVTLGNLVPLLGRSATWTYRADTPGPKAFRVRTWSSNGGEVIATTTVTVPTPLANLATTVVTPAPAFPIGMPGARFSVTDTVQNFGPGTARSSTSRYYLSVDAARNAGDRLLSGSRAVPELAAGATHAGTATVTVPTTTPLGTYVLLACADDRGAVEEGEEGDNCLIAEAGVTVTRPDLVVSAVSAPPASAALGSAFVVTDTVHNPGLVASGSSKARYYLSRDGVKSADDRALVGTRSVPGLAAGGTHSGTVTLTVPTATPLNTYFVLACADATGAVAETSEDNNCRPSGATVTITP